MDFLQLGAQYGFPALLVCFLLWTQQRRDTARDQATAATDSFIREVLVTTIAETSQALVGNSRALAELRATLRSNTRHTDETSEKLDRLLTFFEQHTCPLRDSQAGDITNTNPQNPANPPANAG